MYGFSGRILYVDLTSNTWKVLRPSASIYRRYLGGRGIGAKILLEAQGESVDPLSPEAHIVLAVGPLTGTPIPMNSRVHFVFRSPLTGGWGESSMGGSFPCYMKWAGYDAIVVAGRSTQPVYLSVSPGGCEIVSANDLWGLNAYEAERELIERCGGAKFSRAIVIGPAGENLVRYAAVTHGSLELKIGRGGQAGRSGAGAVFGSKRLKGIVVSVESREVELADPERTREVARELIRELSSKGARLREYGTSAMIDIANAMKFLPTAYWELTSYDKISGVSSATLKESYLKGIIACTTCPIACGRVCRGKTPIGELTVEGPEYETLYSMGPLLGLHRIDDIIALNEYADMLGLDTITLGNVLAFAVKAYRTGRTKVRVDPEDPTSLLELTKDIAYRRGELGDVLADGVLEAAKRLGVEGEAVHFRGLEPPGYDPRGLHGMYIAYASSPRGACHLRSMTYIIDIRGLAGGPDTLSEEKIAKIVEWEDWCSLFDSLTLCKFGRDVYSHDNMVKALNAVTGWDTTVEEIKLIGRRISTLAHMFERNVLGRAADYDVPPSKLRTASKDGKPPISIDELSRYMGIYYRVRGFTGDGRVDSRTVESLGISLEKEVLIA